VKPAANIRARFEIVVFVVDAHADISAVLVCAASASAKWLYRAKFPALLSLHGKRIEVIA
jgi:hypothetical protein